MVLDNMTIDVGSGVRLEARVHEGERHGFAWWHSCRGTEREDFIAVKPCWPDGWEVQNEEPLSLAPSILCHACGLHGFVRAGKWTPA